MPPRQGDAQRLPGRLEGARRQTGARLGQINRIFLTARCAQGAKFAENFLIMFAVERPANMMDYSLLKQEIVLCGRNNKTGHCKCPKGLDLFLFGLSPKRNKKNTLCDLRVSAVNPDPNNMELVSNPPALNLIFTGKE